MDRVFSGIQPTGKLHLGNYLGAIRNWVAAQETHPSIFSIVDYHAMTIDYVPAEMSERIRELAAGILACGIDPDRATLFVQSDVPQHTELAWIFNCVTPMGELSRQTQFKSKSQSNADNINVGLFAYPVLQAADILLYKGNRVPVGKDQEQHLELSREIARKFNARFGPTFPEPKTMFTSTPKIRGLDGDAKMSASLGNTIDLDDDEPVVRKKLARAFTDPQRVKRTDPGNPEVCNIFTLHTFFSDDQNVSEINSACRSASIGCVDCKARLADRLVETTAPIREAWRDWRVRKDDLEDVLRSGANRCREIASETMEEVRSKAGLR